MTELGTPLFPDARVPLRTIAKEWARLGCIGFGGPPAHIALLRRMCVEERRWIDAVEFEDAIATTNLLPGPASTQLAIYCARRLAGTPGALVGGICFIVPGLVVILVLASLFLARHPPIGVLGAALGAGGAVPAVALNASWSFVPRSWRRIGASRSERARWVGYAMVGAVCAATIGPFLVLFLFACGVAEVLWRNRPTLTHAVVVQGIGLGLVAALAGAGGIGALVWVAFKVGALSYGGGFVIIPLMQHDAVATYHWTSGTQFLDAVALGQVTPGPVVQTVAVVGYAARGIGGGLIASLVAFAPSFCFVLGGAPHFGGIRTNPTIGAFLTGTGPAVVGAIAGSAVTLGLAFQHLWQIPILLGALVWLFALRRGVVSALVVSGGIGAVIALAGGAA